ncbi:hypothetical protein [Bacillus solitudinis]|uniref:hypothetical protein n=1 Tax=Bacillus solitudinis TaxID=2014074 RepID=UPI000C2356DF|nr:hypothetical protein [Bacillus solitudinis]
MDYSGLLVISLIAGVFLSYFIRPKLQDKSVTEIMSFSILLVISGFGFVFLNLNSIFSVVGLTLFIIGFFTGTISFLLKRD